MTHEEKCALRGKVAKPTKKIPQAISLFCASVIEQESGETAIQMDDGVMSIGQGFVSFLSELPETRQAGKIVYDIASLTLMIFFSILSGFYNCLEIEFWIEKHQPLFEKWGLLPKGRSPSHDTIMRIIGLYKPEVLVNVFRHIFRDFLGHFSEDGKIICADGKYMCGTDDCGSLNLYEADTRIPLAQSPIKGKGNEIKLLQQVLADINLKGKTLCADALHAQTKTTQLIHENGGFYLISLKNNQKTANEDVTVYVENEIGPKDEAAIEEQVKKLIGNKKKPYFTYNVRNIYKEIYIIPASKLETLEEKFIGITYFVLFRKTNVKTGVVEDLHLITSCNKKPLIVHAIQMRWAAENDLHRPKDMLFDEDKYKTTDKNVANNIAIMNSFALAIVRLIQKAIEAPSLKIARKWVAYDLPGSLMACIKKYGKQRIVAAMNEVKQNKK